MNHIRSLTVLLWLSLAFAHLGSAQESDRPSVTAELLDSILAVHEFKEVAVSPDGRWVAWVEALRLNAAPSPKSAVYMADLHAPAAKPRRITAGDGQTAHDEHGIAWSRDSGRLTFLSDKEQAAQLQVCIATPTGDDLRQLTHVSGFLANPPWSPDGERLALLFTEGVARVAGPTQPANRAAGPAEKLIGQRLAVLDVETGRLRSISPPDHHIYEYDWSPDGGQIVAIAAPAPGDNNWYVAGLYFLPLTAGDMRPLVKPEMQIAAPSWSPDGRTIAFIGGLMSDEGLTGGDIFVIPAAGGEPRNLTAGMQASASWLEWSPSSNELVFAEHVDGASGIASLDVRSGKVKTLWTGAETITATARGYGITPSVSLSRDQKTSAFIRHSFQQPPEIWAGPIGQWRPLTHANEKLQPSWGESKSLHWQNGDERVQGWLIYPSHFEAGRRFPLIVSVHGGPASAWKPRWPRHSDLTWLSALDYFVFCPNPRGSLGQGAAFARANVRDFGHGDLQDILSGMDEIIRTRPEVDAKRSAITGWSYGGYMAMWAVTQTDRFRAAIAGAGIANWQSYYGQNEIDQWLIPYFGASVYDDPAVYAKSSPIEFIKRVATPTLLLVGERDKECPPVQSREFWHALKTLHVPTDLIVYPHEGHSIAAIKHRRDIAERSAAWLQQHLMGTSAPE